MRERYDDIVDAITTWHPECPAGKVFSMPCVKRAGRVACGLSRTGMVFQLTDPGTHARALGAWEFIAKPAPMRHLYEIHTSLNRRW